MGEREADHGGGGQWARCVARWTEAGQRSCSAGTGGEIVSGHLRPRFADPSTALVVWRPGS